MRDELIGKPQINTSSDTTIAHIRHTALGTVHNFVASALALPTGIITAAFLTRQLGPSDYGVLTVTVTIIFWIETAVTLGFSRAALKLVGEAEEWRSAPIAGVLQIQTLVSVTAALIVVAVAPSLSVWLDDPQLKRTLRFLALDIPIFGIAEILMSIMMGRGSYKLTALMKALYWLVRAGLIFLLVTLIPNVTGALLAILGTSGLVMVCSMAFVRPPLIEKGHISLQTMWGYTWPLFVYSVGMQLFGMLDIVFVKALAGVPEAAGFYGAAKNLAIVPYIFAASLSPLLVAKLSELRRKGRMALVDTMSRQSIRLVFCLLPFAGMAAGASDEVVTAIYGKTFLPAAPILAFLIFGTLGSAMISVTVSILIAAGHFKWPIAFIIPLLVMAFLGQMLLVPRLGGFGSACVMATLAFIGAILMLAIVYKACHVLVPPLSVLRSIIVCIIAYFLSSLFPSAGFLVGIKLLLVVSTIVFLFYMVGEINKSDFDCLRKLMGHNSDH